MLEIKNQELFAQIVSDAIVSAITNAKSVQLARRWENAIDRAVREINENPYLHFDLTEKCLVVCSSTSGNTSAANGVCDCIAFTEYKQPCWHRAAARLIRLYLEATGVLPITTATEKPTPAKAASAEPDAVVKLPVFVNQKKPLPCAHCKIAERPLGKSLCLECEALEISTIAGFKRASAKPAERIGGIRI